MSRRPFVAVLPTSDSVRAVVANIARRVCAGEAPWYFDWYSAMAEATSGAAWDVPS